MLEQQGDSRRWTQLAINGWHQRSNNRKAQPGDHHQQSEGQRHITDVSRVVPPAHVPQVVGAVSLRRWLGCPRNRPPDHAGAGNHCRAACEDPNDRDRRQACSSHHQKRAHHVARYNRHATQPARNGGPCGGSALPWLEKADGGRRFAGRRDELAARFRFWKPFRLCHTQLYPDWIRWGSLTNRA